jgi:hypothetical protein
VDELAIKLNASRTLPEHLVRANSPDSSYDRTSLLIVLQCQRSKNSLRSGATSTELAKAYGLSHQSMTHPMHEFGVPVRRQPLTDECPVMRPKLFASGLTPVHAGDRLGVPSSSVRLALRRLGMQMRSPNALHLARIFHHTFVDHGWDGVRSLVGDCAGRVWRIARGRSGAPVPRVGVCGVVRTG